jgi:hypothetical protein
MFDIKFMTIETECIYIYIYIYIYMYLTHESVALLTETNEPYERMIWYGHQLRIDNIYSLILLGNILKLESSLNYFLSFAPFVMGECWFKKSLITLPPQMYSKGCEFVHINNVFLIFHKQKQKYEMDLNQILLFAKFKYQAILDKEDYLCSMTCFLVYVITVEILWFKIM